MYTDDSIIIIRRRGGRIQREDITTNNVLTGGDLSAEQNRKNTIARLRQDPAVLFVLEPRDGRCEEKATLPDGYEMIVTISDAGDGGKREATLTIRRDGETNYETGFEWDEDDDDYDALEDLTDNMILFVDGIEEKEDWLYGLGYLSTRDDMPVEERIPIYSAAELIQEAGYQCESISVSGGFCPLLFVYENEMVLLGSRHFGEYDLFIEVKRLHWPFDAASLEKIRGYCDEMDGVEVVSWEDGSLGFRSELKSLSRKPEFLNDLTSRLVGIIGLLMKIEEREEYFESASQSISERRQLFIYEAIDASLKLSRIAI